MTKFEELQAQHERLMEQSKSPENVAGFAAEVQREIQQMCVAAEDISAPRERDQLRAILRFWASYVYDHTGTYPDTTLHPAKPPAKPAESIETEHARPPLIWMALAAGAVFIILLVVVYFISKPPVGTAPAVPIPPNGSVNVVVTTERPLASQLQITYTILTAGPSPFDADAWVVKLQLSATGGNGSYVFWVDNKVLPDVGNNQYTVKGDGCDPQKPIVGVTSDGKATSLELVIQSPLKCPRP